MKIALTPPQKGASAEDIPEDITLQNSDLLYIGNRLFRVQLNVQRNEPHLDPSRFIHEAFPTHIDSETPSSPPRRHTPSESLVAQARRFFSPKPAHTSEQDSVFPDPPQQAVSENFQSQLEEQETTLSLGSDKSKPRPSNRRTPLQQTKPPIKIFSHRARSLKNREVVDIPEYN